MVTDVKDPSDYCYVLAYSWTADFCSGTGYPGCEHPNPFWLKNFTLHGLWPQYSDSTGYPSFCNKDPYDPTAPEKVGMTKMITYWPNVKYSVGDPSYGSFWEHEWSKHGTCTGLTQEKYFESAVDLLLRYGSPSILSDAVGGRLSATELRASMGGASMVSLQCDGSKKDTLSGAFTCWTQKYGIPGTQIICPDDVRKEDSCSTDILVVK